MFPIHYFLFTVDCLLLNIYYLLSIVYIVSLDLHLDVAWRSIKLKKDFSGI